MLVLDSQRLGPTGTLVVLLLLLSLSPSLLSFSTLLFLIFFDKMNLFDEDDVLCIMFWDLYCLHVLDDVDIDIDVGFNDGNDDSEDFFEEGE